jgi:glutamate formiminotransferase / 5-formyltetrahydrofolate cyclo-ligase
LPRLATPRRPGEIVLEAVPNVSEGEDEQSLAALARAFGGRGCELLDLHSDADYGRSVFTIVGAPESLADALVAGAREAVRRLDIHRHRGVHPCIGVLDVVPIVYLRDEDRADAHDEALALANRLAAEVELPVFLYGELGATPERQERAYFREGGVRALDQRLSRGELEPDFGPAHIHPTAGAALVGARPPLVAFNLELSTKDIEAARAIAARVREGGESGLAGVRAIGVHIERQGQVQLSVNIHDPFAVPLRVFVDAVRSEAASDGVEVIAGELVGLAPAAAVEGFPEDVPLRGFDASRHLLEERLRSG